MGGDSGQGHRLFLKHICACSGRPTLIVKALSSPAVEEPFLELPPTMEPHCFVFWKLYQHPIKPGFRGALFGTWVQIHYLLFRLEVSNMSLRFCILFFTGWGQYSLLHGLV